jgi:hypothetical protein
MLVIINNKIWVKHYFDWTIMEGATRLFRVVLGLRGMKKFVKIGQNFLIF